MIPLTLELIVTYVLFWFFLFYITKWMKEFKGASQKYYLFLTYYSGLGTMFGLAVLVSFGINTELMNALKLMGISIISNMILVVIETFVTTKLLRMDYAVAKIGMVSFFVVPVLGYRLLVLLEII